MRFLTNDVESEARQVWLEADEDTFWGYDPADDLEFNYSDLTGEEE